MAQIIGLPKLSPTMEEGVLVRWVKKEGDSVEPGDLVAEVETDKANMDFNLEDEGVLLKLLVGEGETVKLGSPVAILGDQGEDIAALIAEAEAQIGGGGQTGAAGPPTSEVASANAAAAQPGADAGEQAQGQTQNAQRQTQDAQRQSQASQGQTQNAQRQTQDAQRQTQGQTQDAQRPSQDAQRPSQGQTQDARPASATASAGAERGRLLASPLAKTLALELGVDLRGVRGSGPGGRIVERDVRDVAEGSASGDNSGGATQDAPSSAPSGYAGPDAEPRQPAAAESREPAPEVLPSTALAVIGRGNNVPAPVPPSDEYVDKPLSSMRKRIAERMTAAKRDVPHFYLRRSFHIGPLLAFRKRLNDLLGERGKVSVNDLLIKGAALALRRVPECNAAFLGDAIRYYTRVHIGVAVAIDEGLVTPVVRDVDLKGLARIGDEVRQLAERARSRQLKVHEIQGSTFTVSNLGMFGIDSFEAIINPPEAAILAIGAAADVPVSREDELVMQKHVTLSLSCDHRVIDGALGARYLQELVAILEKPESLAL